MGKKEQTSQSKKPLSEKVLGKLFGLACQVIYGCVTNQETQEKLTLLEEHLNDGSAVVYFNHNSLADGPMVYGFLLKRLGRSLTMIGGPASQRHADSKREHSPLSSIMKMAPLVGIQLNPVVQHYDQKSYSDVTNTGLLRSFTLQSKEILRKKGGILVIAPEGTRSPDGTLQEAQQGIGHCDRYGLSVAFCPLAIIPRGKSDEGLNLGRRFDIKVGPPFSADDLRKEGISEDEKVTGRIVTDRMMKRLAALLPEKMRGYYR